MCPLCDASIRKIEEKSHLFLDHRDWLNEFKFMPKQGSCIITDQLDPDMEAPFRKSRSPLGDGVVELGKVRECE